MRKKKKKKQYDKNKNPVRWDKISFEKREKIRAELKKQRVYTKSFSTRQKFGPASDVIILDPAAFQEYNTK